MSLIEPLNFLDHYHKGYKNKIFSDESVGKFTKKLKEILKDTFRTEDNLKYDISTNILVELFDYETVIDFKKVDLCIKKDENVNVIFEFKSINSTDLKDIKKSKALCETIWYFHKIENNENIKNIVITNGKKWFFIDPRNYNLFEKLCKNFQNHRLNIDSTEQLYEKIKQQIKNDNIDFDYTEIDLSLKTNKDTQFKLLYKLLYKDFLLREFSYKDSNELNSRFYSELLYILGLKESQQKGKLVIVENNEIGSLTYLIRNCLNISDFESILNLLTIWLNRIIFLKLFDSQLSTFTNNSFFNSGLIKNWNDLNDLFFNILGKPISERILGNKFQDVPYLNSSLFERTIHEQNYGNISNLNNDCKMRIKSNSILQKIQNYPKHVQLLKYLLDFFDCYNFTQINSESKEIISTSVLGLIFEKLNGYKDGSFFTPSAITEYMAKDCIKQIIIDKFNEKYNLVCNTIEELKEYLSQYNYIKEKKNEYNKLFNSIKIIDIAVGSGHFLVSCLNYLVYLKYELGLLNNSVLNGCRLAILNDNLTIFRPDGIETFIYRRQVKSDLEIQKHIFETKKLIIQNCLFGSDINPKSVEICCLRLWIELLKNTYYKTNELNNNDMETLPNIDINIRCGNSILNVAHPKINESFINCIEFQISHFDLNGYVNLVKKYSNSPSFSEKSKIKKEMTRQRNDLILYMKSNTNNIEYMVDFPELLDNDYKFCGFDLVIGNPPYIKEYENRHAFDGLRESPYYEGKMDLWSFFTCIGIDLLKHNGYLSFIAPNNWTTNYGAEIMRNKILADTQIQKIIDFNDYMVFDDASIQTMIFKLKKINDNSYSVNLSEKIEDYELNYYKINSDKLLLQKENFDNINFPKFCNYQHYSQFLKFNNKIIDLVLNKIYDVGQYKIDKNSLTNGIHTHHSKVTNKMLDALPNNKIGDSIFVLTTEEFNKLPNNEKVICKPYFEKSISKYFNNRINSDWIIYTDSSFKKDLEKINSYPNIKEHLDKFKDVISSDNGPYGIHRSRKEEFFTSPKIVSLRMCSDKPIFTYVHEPMYFSAMFFILKPKCDLIYLTGLLNSKLATFWLKFRGKMQGNNYQVDAEPIMNIPLCINKNTNIENKISKLTKEIIDSKNLDKTKIKEIDNLVYKLYDLSDDQIMVIEDNIPDI